MQLLGHKDIRMTLRYVGITQQDLQREFHQARQDATHPIACPRLRSLKTSRAPVSPLSVRHWSQHVICWKCTAAS